MKRYEAPRTETAGIVVRRFAGVNARIEVFVMVQFPKTRVSSRVIHPPPAATADLGLPAALRGTRSVLT
jgi:hypothetical protein